MNRWILLAAALACLPATVDAGVISRDWKTPGDGLLTYDDVNKREWLDLSESRLASFPGANRAEQFQNILAELAPGGIFQGFVFANRASVNALAQSAGITVGSSDFAANDSATRSLIALLGSTFEQAPNIRSTGFIDEVESGYQVAADFFISPQSGSSGAAGVIVASAFRNDAVGFPNTGMMLYQNVPEPSAGVLALLLLFAPGRRSPNRTSAVN